ncbi:pentapeptide repeat-containing protein [Pseudoclavibacter sp. VKM Ac-2867]|uniref:pentapeptide repeat-containing protein n=1 Tax=Pseudoclavibacter sp. VKM Ac-2867 TaxID=2783829 RepID=UPI001E63783F|nr:pentapeptide repeat-containing protein [Pseudoclavibacter sp. VKM Ac-2867]
MSPGELSEPLRHRPTVPMPGGTARSGRGASADTARFRSDCANCVALCCSALAFSRGDDFAHEKPAGKPCRNLDENLGCGIHSALLERGYRGCTVFECHGAGQRVTQETFGGGDWREGDDLREAMFAVFPLVRQLHEVLWLLAEARRRTADRSLLRRIDTLFDQVDVQAASPDLASLRAAVETSRPAAGELLGAVSHEVRRMHVPRRRASGAWSRIEPRGVYLGTDLSGSDLRAVELRGALLIAAKLRGADLRWADLLGADLRDAELHGADLRHVLHLTQPQLAAAFGDDATQLPESLTRPRHWG